LLERKKQAALPPADSYVPPDPKDPDSLVVVPDDSVAGSMIRPSARY
jgi:hypothetical protein